MLCIYLSIQGKETFLLTETKSESYRQEDRKMVTGSDAFPKEPLPVTGAPSCLTQEFRMEFGARPGTLGKSEQPNLVVRSQMKH